MTLSTVSSASKKAPTNYEGSLISRFRSHNLPEENPHSLSDWCKHKQLKYLFPLLDDLLSKRAYKEAFDLIKEGKEIFPHDLDLSCYEGRLYFLEGHFTLATKIFELITEIDPQHQLAWLFLLNISCMVNDHVDKKTDKIRNELLLKVTLAFADDPITCRLHCLKGQLYSYASYNTELKKAFVQISQDCTLLAKALLLGCIHAETALSWNVLWGDFLVSVHLSPRELTLEVLFDALSSCFRRDDAYAPLYHNQVLSILEEQLIFYPNSLELNFLRVLVLVKLFRYEECLLYLDKVISLIEVCPNKHLLYQGSGLMQAAILDMFNDKSFGTPKHFIKIVVFLEYFQLPELSKIGYQRLHEAYPHDLYFHAKLNQFSLKDQETSESLKSSIGVLYEKAATGTPLKAKLSLLYGKLLFNYSYHIEAFTYAFQGTECLDQYVLMGNLYCCVSEFSKGIEFYDKALKVNPQYGAIWQFKAMALCTEKDYEESVACWKEAVRLEPTNSKYHHQLGILYRVRLNYIKNKIKACFSIEPAKHPKANRIQWENEASKHTKEYDTTEKNALDCFKKAVKFTPNHADALYNQIIMLFYSKRYEKALAKTTQFISITSKLAVIFKIRGDTAAMIKTGLRKGFDLKLNPNQVAYDAYKTYSKIIKNDQGEYNLTFAKIAMRLSKVEKAYKILSSWTIPDDLPNKTSLEKGKIRLLIGLTEDLEKRQEHYELLNNFRKRFDASEIDDFNFIFAKAALYLDKEDEVIALMSNWEVKIPQDELAHVNRLIKANDPDAQGALESLTDHRNETDLERLTILISLLSRKNDDAPLVANLNSYLELNPENHAYRLKRGLSYLALGQIEKAIEDIEKVYQARACPENILENLLRELASVEVNSSLPNAHDLKRRHLYLVCSLAVERKKFSAHFEAFHEYYNLFQGVDIENFLLSYAKSAIAQKKWDIGIAALKKWKPDNKAFITTKLELQINIYRSNNNQSALLEVINQFIELNPKNKSYLVEREALMDRAKRSRLTLIENKIIQARKHKDNDELLNLLNDYLAENPTSKAYQRERALLKKQLEDKEKDVTHVVMTYRALLQAINGKPEHFEREVVQLGRELFALIWNHLKYNDSHPLKSRMIQDPLSITTTELAQFCLQFDKQIPHGKRGAISPNEIVAVPPVSLARIIPEKYLNEADDFLPSDEEIASKNNDQEIVADLYREVRRFQHYFIQGKRTAAIVSLYFILHYQRKFDFVGKENPLCDLQSRLSKFDDIKLSDVKFLSELVS